MARSWLPLHGRSRGVGRRWFSMLIVNCVLLGLLVPVLQTSSVYASSVTTMSFSGGTGTASANGTFYARSGASVTLTVNTTSDTNCVTVTGDPSGGMQQTANGNGQSSWTFNFTAGSGNTPVNLTATAYDKVNKNNVCAGSSNSAQTSYTLDNIGPVVTATLSPQPNGAGWNNSTVGITWSATDNGSGVGSGPAPATDSVTADTGGVTKMSTATDKVGISTTGSVVVKLDTTKPTITGSRSPAANANGWNNTDVTASFLCSDALSGIKTCSGPTTFSSDGANKSVTGTAVDAADNSSSATVSGINVDKTPPTLSGAPTTGPNGNNGWYTTNVAVAWTCNDALSGINGSCPANSTISSEGSGLTASASVSDKAGNTTNATSNPAVKIDKTPPTTLASAPSAWTNSNVTVTLSPSDAVSGVAATHYALDGGATQDGTTVAITTEGTHSLKFWSVDNAGNAETPKTIQILIDKSAPLITHTLTPAANGNGWNNANVTVTFTCTDPTLVDGTPGSGIASCTTPQTVSTEGANQPVTGKAVDNAGNSATDPATVSIDTTPPSISGSTDRAANANSWYNANVTVSFACADTLSGIASCTAPVTLSTDGANQSKSGTAVDAASNSSSATVSGINLDKTPPALSGAVTTSPNSAGWYKGNVTVHWTCSDALSGIATGACPADSTVTGEGGNLSASASVSDKAGNSTPATVSGIEIDRTPPSTSASSNAPVPNGWNNVDVTVTLNANDNLSGVAATQYSLDGGATQSGTAIAIHANGVHTLTYWSVDKAGNTESAHSLQVEIDESNPTIAHALTPAANARGWNNSDVTVNFTCADQPGLSGVASCTGPQTVSAEGAGQQVSGRAVDNAGNTVTDPATVNIDKTKPIISGAPDRTANANGWYNGDVTVTFTCDDALSGVATCTPAKTLGEGANQSVTGTAVDAAGNSSSTTLSGINVDQTAPSLSGAPTTPANANGWYNGDVAIHWTCSDPKLKDGAAGSGIDGSCPADSTVTGEGSNRTTQASVSDLAGNTTTVNSTAVKIDRTPPTTGASAPSGWQNNDVTVTLAATDNLSEVAATYYTVDGGAQQSGTSISITAEGTHTVTFWSVDKAGNAETANSIHVQIDKTAPTIGGAATTKPNANGWYSGPVTIHFTCSDPKLADGSTGSGVASCQPDVTLSADGANQSVTGTATDNAGNFAKATVGGINIDSAGPAVTIKGVADSATYMLGAVPSSSCSASDVLSGLAGPCTGSVSGGLANGVGRYTYTATATDNAGNTTTVKAAYTVVYNVPLNTAFFLQPVNDTAHQIGLATSVFKAGSTVPMKFQLKRADGTIVQANSAPIWLTPVKGSSTGAAVNESAYTASGDSGNTYRSDGTQYIYNWQTPSTGAGYCWRVGVKLDDGQTYFVNIGLR